MARPERPLDPAAGPLALLAIELRKLRGKQTYSELSRKTHLAASTLNSAAGGARLPSWEVTRVFTDVCGGDLQKIRRLWEQASVAASQDVIPVAVPGEPPRPEPETVTSVAQFIELLTRLRAWAGNPSLAELNKRAGWFDLPPSTVSEMLRNKHRLPRLELVAAFVRACGLDDDQATGWEQAWAALRARQLLPGRSLPPEPADPPSPARQLRDGLKTARRNARDLLAWVSGAQLDLLRRSPHDRATYAGLGAAILASSVLAAVSLMFALHIGIRMALPAAVPVGLAWGAAIMGIDRFFVLGISRPFRSSEWYKTVPTVIPRLVLAILIGVVISTPMVMQMYAPEIAAEIVTIRQQQAKEFTTSQQNSALAHQIQQVEAQVTRAQNVQAAAERKWVCEVTGKTCAGATGVPGGGNLARLDLEQFQVAEATTNHLMAELNTLRGQEQQQEAAYNTASRQAPGLLSRLEALNQLAAHNTVVALSRLLVLLLLVFIDILPIIIRVVQVLGPPTAYERMLDLQKRADIRLASRYIRAEAAAQAQELPEPRGLPAPSASSRHSGSVE